jgi:hypothetical protein
MIENLCQPPVKIKYPLTISGTKTMGHTLQSMGFNRHT